MADEGEQEFFVVERILGKGKDIDGNTIYKVKWEGFPEEEATWEPEANLEGNPLLSAYE